MFYIYIYTTRFCNDDLYAIKYKSESEDSFVY